MRVPRRVTYALLLALLGGNYLLRYPQIPHELGPDAFVFHGMTLSLIQRGHAGWIVTPLSYLGLYPLSHPSGSMFMLGSLSLASGFPVEGAILLYDFALVALGLLASFFLSIEIRRDDTLALLVATIFSFAPRFVVGLLWEVPTRALFLTLLPVFLLLMIRWYRTRSTRFGAIMALTLFLMMSAHRLTVLMAAVMLAALAAAIVLVVAKTLRIRFASRILTRGFRTTASVFLLGSFFAASVALLVVGGVLESYQGGRVSFGSGILAQLTNLVGSLGRSAGPLVVLVPVGAVATYRFRSKGFKEPFLLLALLVLIPTLSLRQYTGYYVIPFTSLFAGIGLWSLVARLRSSRIKLAIIAVTIAASLVATQSVVQFELTSGDAMKENSYQQGLYVMHQTSGTVISNDGRTGAEVFAVSGHPYLPVGGATTPFQSPELLIFGFVDRGNLRIISTPVEALTIESDSPFTLQNVNAETDWSATLDRPHGLTAPRIEAAYHPRYLLEVWDANGGYFAYGYRYPSPYVESVKDDRYRIFEIEGQTLWYLGGPS